MKNQEKELGLAEMIDSLRKELKKAQDLAGDSPLIFEVEKIDLELQLNMEKTIDNHGKVGIKFWVASGDIGAKETDKKVTSQTIRLSLTSKDLANNGGKTTIRG